jgi:hypothetical protein
VKNISFVDAKTIPADQIIRFESSISKLARQSEFVSTFLDIGTGLAAVDDQTKEVVGLIVVYPCDAGYRVGPWYADSEQIARSLLNRLLTEQRLDKCSLFLDIPYEEGNNIARIIDECGWEKVIQLARMWTGSAEIIEDLERLYAHWTVEQG